MPKKRDSGKRNYIKEAKWEKEKYDILRIKLDKGMKEILKQKLAEDNMTISQFVRNEIIKYLNK